MLHDINCDISVRLANLPTTHTLYNALPDTLWKIGVFMKLKIVGREFNNLLCREYNYNINGSYGFYDEFGRRKYSLNINWLELGTQIYKIKNSSDVYAVKLSERQPQILHYNLNI
jgi:hypothetical protein